MLGHQTHQMGPVVDKFEAVKIGFRNLDVTQDLTVRFGRTVSPPGLTLELIWTLLGSLQFHLFYKLLQHYYCRLR